MGGKGFEVEDGLGEREREGRGGVGQFNAREHVVSLHQNHRTQLIYSKNNVIV